MKHTIVEYTSNTGIYFHHTVTTYKDGELGELPPESHHMYEIFILLSGAVEYQIEGQVYNLSPMNVLIIPPQKMHSMTIDTSLPYERMVLQFSANLFPTFVNKELNITLHTYIFKQRMQLAKKLLLQGNSPQAVSEQLGYEYYSTFYHNFMKCFEYTPNYYTNFKQVLFENIDY